MLDEVGCKLRPSKCELFCTQIAYHGHIVSKDGIKMDPKRLLDLSTGQLQLL